MADRNEFLKGYRSFRQRGGKAPPADSQKVDTFKPQEYKRSAFAESYFQYQGMMNKELERINKEAEKAEQDIIKQQQREGGAGLGAGVQLGAPEMAPEPLSPETGAIGPPSGLEQLYQQSVPSDLQATAFPQPGALQPAPEAAPTEPAPLLSEQLPLMQPAQEQLAALGDVAGAFGTGMAAFLPSMLGGYLEGTIPTAFPQVGVPPQPAPREPLTSKEKAEAVTEVQDTIAGELSYMPRTKLGMEATEALSLPFEKVQQFATWSSSAIIPEDQPFLRKIVEDTIHLGTYVVAHKTGRIGTKAFKRGVSKYRGLPEERITVKNIEADIKSAQDKLPKRIKDKTTTFLKNIKAEVTENLKDQPKFSEVEMIAIELAREQGGPQAAKIVMDELVARKKPPTPPVKKPPPPAPEVKKPAPTKAELRRQERERVPQEPEHLTAADVDRIVAKEAGQAKSKAEVTELLDRADTAKSHLEEGGTVTKAQLLKEIEAVFEEVRPALKKPAKPAPPVKKVPPKGFAKEVIEAVPKKLAKDVIEEAGGQYIGIRKGKEGVIPDYVTFNEKTTNTTIEIPLSEVTPERIKAELAKKVEAFKAAEPPAPPKPRTEAELKAAVEEGGGQWGAEQEIEGKMVFRQEPTVVKGKTRWTYQSPYTKSTKMMLETEITPERIKNALLEDYVKEKQAGGKNIIKLWDEGETAFAQTKVEGVKPAAPEPTKPPAKLAEIPEKKTLTVRSGPKEDVSKEFMALSKRAPDTLSDVPKDQPTWIKVEHEGTMFTIPNTNYALETFAKKIDRLKEGKIGPPEPPRKPRPTPKATGGRPAVDIDAGDTFTRLFTKDTKFKKPQEKDVWSFRSREEEGIEELYLIRGKHDKRTFFSDGHIVEYRDTAPTMKVKLGFDELKDVSKIDSWSKSKDYKPAKAPFDTELGVAIMNKENGFFVAHNYFDYIRTKYGPKVQWEIPPPDSGLPIRFSVDGKLEGFIMPLNPEAPIGGGLIGTPHNILAERFPKGFGPGPALEAGGFQTMYEGIRDVIKSPKFFESTYLKAKGAKDFVIDEIVDPLRFYPHLPKDYVNDVRVHMVAALDRARHKVYSKEGYAGRIFKDMKKDKIYDAVELIYARDEVGRQKAGRGNPELALEEATKIRDTLEASASAETLRVADEWRAVTDEVQADLVRRGVLRGPDPKTGYEGQFIEDYAPHAVGVYTPEWAYTVGIPTRLRTPFRSFKQKAKGTVKEIVKDADTLLGHLLKVEHTNMIEDFIIRETAKYDIIPTMSREQKIALFGSRTHERLVKSKVYPEGIMKEIEVVNTPKPGRIWTEEELAKVDPSFKGKGDHWSYTPDQPFSRTIYMTDEGQMALGRYKNVSLIPADIFRSFKSFSESGSPLVYRMNLITGYWKNMAILSHFPSFNMNNLIGDTFMAAIQHPQPTRLLIEMETSLKYLVNEARAKPHTGHLKELHKFIQSEDVLGASFFMTELPKQIKGSKNPLRMILDKSMTISQMREGINRTAYASTLLKSMKEGTASEMIKAHSWIDTKGLDQKAALGKIAREVLVDYAAVSKGFRRIGRGMLTPFGTWYFHNSRLVHRWMWKNKGKALVGMFAAPLAAQAWNNRNEEARQRELRRPDWLRNKIHFDIEETPAGDARTWALQLPQDVLIGTKIFTIATDMASRVYRGEINPANGKPWTPRDAAIRTIKEWGVQEYRGVAYLMAPLIRFYIGLKDRRDPYDKVPIYSAEYNSLNPMQRKLEGAQFFIKTMVPFLGANIIKTQQKKQPVDIAFHRFLDNFIGKEAIGIFDVTPKGEIRLGNGKVYTMDDTARIKWVSNQVLQYFNNVERAYIGFRGSNQEFVQSDKFTNTLVEMYDMMGQIDPKLFKPELDEKAKAGIMSQLYGERLLNMLIDPGTQQNRLEVMIERAKTDEERKQIREEYEKQRQARIFLGLRRQPKMERELMFKRKMDGSTLPWQLELYMPP